MTPDPYQRLLAKMAAEAAPEGQGAAEVAAWWRKQAEAYARVADEMLREWRAMYRQVHPSKHDGPMGD